MSELVLPYKWRPRWYQRPLWNYLEKGGKRALQVAHRRWGKDDVCLHWTARSAFERVGTYWHMLPIGKQARKAIWDAVNPHTGKRRIDEAFPPQIRLTTKEDEMFIRFVNGSTWQVLGSDNFQSFIGSPPIGLVYSEWAQANPLAWAYIRPVLAENGGWSLFITTPRGKNHAFRMLQMAQASKDWYANIQGVDHTQAINADILKNELKEMQSEHGDEQGLSLYEQEYMCSFEAAILGSVYGAQLKAMLRDGRVRPALYDPELEVHTVWDVGFDDSTFIFFYQIAGAEVRVIEFYENHLQTIAHYCGQVFGYEMFLDMVQLPGGTIDLRGRRGDPLEGLEHRRAYRYGSHHGPHDTGYKLLAAGGKSIVEQADAMGLRMICHPAATQQNQIEATRAMLKHTYFDEKECMDALEIIKQYRFEWDDEKKIFKPTPLHDFSSHAADALELLALIRQSGKIESKAAQPTALKPLSSMTANEVFWPSETIETYKDDF